MTFDTAFVSDFPFLYIVRHFIFVFVCGIDQFKNNKTF